MLRNYTYIDYEIPKVINLFKKAAGPYRYPFWTERYPKIHNEDCENFIDWYIERAKIIVKLVSFVAIGTPTETV